MVTAAERLALQRRSAAALLEVVERESLLLLLSALYVAAVLFRLPYALGPDSWLALAAGREVLDHGLPHVETLTTWARGAHWVDQQWLAQASFAGLARIGGVKLALLGHAALVVAAFGLAVTAGRRLGGSSRAVALVSVVALPQLAQDWQLRSQSFAYVLFVAVLALLVADARLASRRVLWCLPLLVLWANLHGSVLIGALLVAAHGARLVRRPERRALGLALVVVPWGCVLASPYAAALPGYYLHTLGRGDFSSLVTEWAPTTLTILTAPFFALAVGAVWLVARSRPTRFDQLALGLTLVAGLVSLRNMVWFSLAAMVILPRLLDAALRESTRAEAGAAFKVGLPLLGAVVAGAVGIATVARPASAFEHGYPRPLAQSVAAADRSGAPVFADLAYGDWLLYTEPSLRGRLEYDTRLELLSPRQLANVYYWRSHVGQNWRAIPGCRAVIVVNRKAEPTTERALLRLPKVRRTYEDPGAAVLVRSGC